MRFYLSLIAVLSFLALKAQIVDDSTRNVYGPKTTLFTTEKDILNNTVAYQTLDTSIYLFERQSFVEKSGRRYQDLGNLGTALFPIFYEPPQTFGRASGYDAYTPFAFQPADIKYFDTKSPYIDLFILLGGGNRNIVDVGFSRNVNENWNVGFDVRRITTNKQLAPESQIDRQVVSGAFTAYTHYKHSKLPYQLLLNFSDLTHQVVELGGVRPTADSSRADLFLYDNALLRLDDAQSIIKTSRWHLYQDYQIADQFQLYHVLDYRREVNTYTDFAGGTGLGGYDPYSDFYDEFLIDEDSTYQQTIFTTFSNEVGLKGDLSSVFYRFYARVRDIGWNYFLFDPDESTLENYLGGYVRFDWKDKFAVTGNAEYLIGGEYSFGGTLASDLLDVSYRSVKSVVPFIYSDYFGNHHEWHNSFEPIFVNDLSGKLNLKYRFLEVQPKLRLATYKNFVYFDESIEAQQETDEAVITSIGGNFNLRILNEKKEGWNIENEVIATNVAGAGGDKFRIPELFYNGRYFWRGMWFRDLIPVEVGIDAHARSSYFANAYAPEIQQFYLQNDQEIFGYLFADLFINMQVDKFLFSLKWHHFNQPQNDGYFTTPNYPGQRRTIDLMVKWMFFD